MINSTKKDLDSAKYDKIVHREDRPEGTTIVLYRIEKHFWIFENIRREWLKVGALIWRGGERKERQANV